MEMSDTNMNNWFILEQPAFAKPCGNDNLALW